MIHAKRAHYNVSQEIQRPPPRELLYLFRATASGVHERINELQQNMDMALEIVDSCLENFAEMKTYWKTANDAMEMRFDAFKNSLETKKSCLQAFARNLPCRNDMDIDHLNTIPNIEDIDHIIEDDDDEDMI
ncbi:hypothetical protein AC1031_010148 [Aphanomyces cochlioides]|nr:hypothetical protein AC1031_010148 [Aphanomyces cochlioides]